MKLTPAQQQYRSFKQQHPDCVLLFRLGDFYELFYEDAHIAHKVLGITLTARDKHAEQPIPMAGIPYHALEKYLPKLIEAGHKVAIADQVGDVVPGKLVERKVTQVITPGTWIEEGKGVCYLLAITGGTTGWTIARGDISIGVWTIRSFFDRADMLMAVAQLGARELLLDEQVGDKAYLQQWCHDHLQTIITIMPQIAQEDAWLKHHLGVTSLDGFGNHFSGPGRIACSLLFQYLISHQQSLFVRRIESWDGKKRVLLDSLTIKNLELFVGSYQGSKKHSLYALINTCRTAMGKRLLAQWLQEPVQDIVLLKERQDAIAYRIKQGVQVGQEVLTLLQTIGDLPRIYRAIDQQHLLIKQFVRLRDQIQGCLQHAYCKERLVRRLSDNCLSTLQDIVAHFFAVIKESSEDMTSWIRPGYDHRYDECLFVHDYIEKDLLDYQQYLLEKTGVSVKIKRIMHQGYVLEVTPKDIDRFEAHLDSDHPQLACVRAQTLKTGQRYRSPIIDAIESRLLAFQDTMRVIEEEIMIGLVQLWKNKRIEWDVFSDEIALLDLYCSHAMYVLENKRTCPEIHTGYEIAIYGGRHPVVEHFLSSHDSFVPNDVVLTDQDFFHLITGPNMGGKSTYMRQQAIILLLAHSGLWVPAKKATIGLVDGIFARVGSGDIIAQQQSTFMTEMVEMSAILHSASSRSFVIIDELGRGTSTFDGLALAKAISVYICQQIKCKTLFATHYHELIGLESMVHGCSNWSMSVYEHEEGIVFLKKVVQGGIDKSYGLEVAKLAGIPHDVLGLARQYLADLEKGFLSKKPHQESLVFGSMHEPLLRKLDQIRSIVEHLDINTLTPLDAFRILSDIVKGFKN